MCQCIKVRERIESWEEGEEKGEIAWAGGSWHSVENANEEELESSAKDFPQWSHAQNFSSEGGLRFWAGLGPARLHYMCIESLQQELSDGHWTYSVV